MTEVESPAALLERAAAVLEDRAAAADPGPWISFGDGWALVSAPVHDDRRTWRTVAGEMGENGRANMAWMNSMSPKVAGPLVRLLRRMASVFGTHRTWRDVDPDCPEVALARAILGETGQECRREAGESSMTGASESSDGSRFEEILQQHRSEFGAMLALHAPLSVH